MKKRIFILMIILTVMIFVTQACNKTSSPDSPTPPKPAPTPIKLNGLTNTDGVAAFADNYLGKTLSITARDIGADSPLSGMNVRYINTYHNIIVIISDPNKHFAPNIKVIPIPPEAVKAVKIQGTFKLVYDVYMAFFDATNMLIAYSGGSQELPSLSLSNDGMVPLVCGTGSFDQKIGRAHV